jgi:RNA polymerase sigma-70 factor (ECF subfamily)
MVLSDDGSEVIAFLYEKHFQKLLYDARQILGEERAADAVHDVFIKLIEKYEKNIEILRDKPTRYFVIVNRNNSIDLKRRRDKRKADVSLDDESFENELRDLEVTPEDAAISNEQHVLLARLIKRLNPTMREILEYSLLAECSNKEIAKLLDIPETTVSSRLNRAKEKLRELIEKNDEALL